MATKPMTDRTTDRTLDGYLSLPYTIVLTHDRDDDGNEGFVAEVRELPGCMSQGETPEDAVRSVYDAMAGWISVALEDGPRLLRLPRQGKRPRTRGPAPSPDE